MLSLLTWGNQIVAQKKLESTWQASDLGGSHYLSADKLFPHRFVLSIQQSHTFVSSAHFHVSFPSASHLRSTP